MSMNARPSVDSREVQDGVVIDLDEKARSSASMSSTPLKFSTSPRSKPNLYRSASDHPRLCRKLREGGVLKFVHGIARGSEPDREHRDFLPMPEASGLAIRVAMVTAGEV